MFHIQRSKVGREEPREAKIRVTYFVDGNKILDTPAASTGILMLAPETAKLRWGFR